ncbi:MAG: GNAT family N-acetyltransferase [Anaerocolumna aminovalerica]|jgi:ribosomal protein S18 acetylase RimI-like enzyme|uniref:GNAT family N-acetyltransferase n=1 Tax=Anaerocolumna aminovalerica TaxID=1527 RepID=UPI001C0F1343|nr:GNAT family N-acetyltransferase [Anaerocolumna aminovalerica]MBU5331023.1 GNAT family N-acetyltransferase [Anaerocolumna aminovalerica]MDU6264083.1 GNAT family N-acetyltransferase [Anaerocolumna aminovalerica]
MFCYRALDKISIETLHKTFLDAFSDYQVNIALPLWKFEQMLQRRGYVSQLSIGAFENEILVGFILNGFRSWNGKPTVYDLGTGVIVEYRRQGITSNMLLNIKELLKQKQVEQYLLEVIESNTSAVSLYKKQGFEIQREFSCFQLDKRKYNPITTCKVERVNRIDLGQLTDFWDFKPSWQNSIDSINAVPEEFLYSIVRLDNTIVGYGIIDKRTGDIPQIAVNRHYRGRGIARSIMTEMIKNTESDRISILNVDNESESTKNFLLELGFVNSVGQYEMLLKI